MAIKRVIAYPMHEQEWLAAGAIDPVQQTDSYLIGTIDDSGIAALEAQGLIVDELPAAGPPTTSAIARGALTVSTGVEAWTAGDNDDMPAPEPHVPIHWMVSLDGPLDADRRTAVEAAGARLEEYVPRFAYVATATPEQAEDLVNLPFVHEVARYGPEVTGPITLTDAARGEDDGQESATPRRRVWELWLSEESVRDSVRGWLSDRQVAVIGAGGRKVRLEMDPDPALESRIATLPGVLSMVEYVPPKLCNDVARVILGVTSSNPGHDLAYRGAGQIVAVADTGLDETHPDFQGRVAAAVALGRPGNASDPNGHGTHVAGSVLGDGVSSAGKFRGVAPEARLYFQSVLDSGGDLGGLPVALEDLFEPAYQAGARIHNNSWGAATASAYTVNSNEVDDYVAKRRDMLIVIAAGNEGTAAAPVNSAPGFVDWLSLGSPASCKNALTVGAARSSRTSGGISTKTYGGVWSRDFPNPPIATDKVSGNPECMAAFSSRGPCDDHRIKPDLVAPGTDILSTRSSSAPAANYWGQHANSRYAYMGGTSMACPLVAGCAALVREYFVAERDTTPSAALLKATLINGTRWLSGADATADHRLRPNYHQGFGEVDLGDTLPSPAEPTFRLEFVDTWKSTVLRFTETGRAFRFTVQVGAGLPLRICMAYTDLPGRALQNDVSMIVEDPGRRKFVGNADLPGSIRRPSDAENNVEVVRVEDPTPGRWVIQVFARNLLRGPQDFALVATGELASPLRRATQP
ncbi:S8 family serine peptidase [Rhodococcus tukisamuensis]|uniref:Subtilase family protein n=1 Tax=Rhodococcus tukisamuensis TaxID=168276 RepID=A0A1G6RCR4_9NOCA|nr:S8 family serine peptidase [Rhodococcus tukisamuensis]SDD02419.1 Subtilase family protein [Rhodococcus tukisamuensis]